jgi:hypothetical protein
MGIKNYLILMCALMLVGMLFSAAPFGVIETLLAIYLIWLGSWVGPRIIPYEFPKESVLPKVIFALYCVVVIVFVFTQER